MNTQTAIEKIISYALTTVDKERQELELTTCYHWCMEYVKHVLNKILPAKYTLTLNYSCSQSINAMWNSLNKYWYEPEDDMKVGDIIFYNWYHDYDPTGNLDHVGIVVEVYPDRIITIEGNTESQYYGDMRSHVRKVTRYRNTLDFSCQYPDYYMRLRDLTDEPTTAETNTINPVPSTTSTRSSETSEELFNQIFADLAKLKEMYLTK